VVVQYRYYFMAYGTGTAATAAAFGLAIAGVLPIDLGGVVAVRSGVYVLIAAIVVAGYVVLTRRHPEFRFHAREAAA